MDEYAEDEYSEIPENTRRILVDEDYKEEDDEYIDAVAEFNFAR